MSAALSHRHAAARRAARQPAALSAEGAALLPASEQAAVRSLDWRPARDRQTEHSQRWRARGNFALAAVAVIAVHGAVVWLAHVWQTHTAMRVPQPLPMSVTLTSAPRPLPQGSPAQAATQPATPPLPTMPLEPPKPSKPQAVKPVEHRVAAPTPEARPETKRETEPATARTSAPAPNAQPSQTATQSTAQTAPTSASATQHSNIPPTSAPIGDAAYLHNPAPDYPQFAQDQGWEGRVLLRVHVLVDGSADSVSVQSSSGRRVLDDAARDAVRGWRFVPAKRGDEAVDGWVTVPIDFRLAQ